MKSTGGNEAGKMMPKRKGQSTRAGMGAMPKSMPKGMHPAGHKMPSNIPASTGKKLHKKKGR